LTPLRTLSRRKNFSGDQVSEKDGNLAIDYQQAFNMPKISIVMPLYNKVKHIALAINSVLSQTIRGFDLPFLY